MLHLGDLFDVLPTLASNSIDSCVTDPPYGLEFMGKEWDTLDGEAWRTGAGFSQPGIGDRPTPWASYGTGDSANATCAVCGGRMRGAKKCACAEPAWVVKGQPLDQSHHDSRMAQGQKMQAWHTLWACEVYRVLKPGAYLVAFGGTRTFHRLTCALEDAGFDVRDCLMWLYGTGFPKSLDVSKAIDKRMGVDRARVGVQTGTGYTKANVAQGAQGRETWAWPKLSGEPASAEAQTWVGWGTALKPGWEPIVLCRKPLQGTVAQNVLTHGTGALNIDGCRIESGPSNGGERSGTDGAKDDPSTFGLHTRDGREIDRAMAEGRWPANVVLDESVARQLDEQSGDLGTSRGVGAMASDGAIYGNRQGLVGSVPKGDEAIGYGDHGGASRFFTVVPEGRWPANVVLDEQAAQQLDQQSGTCAAGSAVSGDEPSHTGVNTYGEYGRVPFVPYDDAGGASRFFYVAKPDRQERDAGTRHLETQQQDTSRHEGDPGGDNPRNRGASQRGNFHPTVKPVALMRWLVRLITPPHGTCLDPFMGSGTTGMACRAEMREFVGIEREADYMRIAEARMAEVAPLFHEAPKAQAIVTQPSMFDED